jgi:uncharacterized membrane protein
MSERKITLQKALPYILIIGGIIGYYCSFILSLDKIHLLQNPHFIPSCNLNPVLSCGNVMHSKQADVFGFPNPFIGLGAFPVVIVVGGAMLAGAKFKRWFWLALETGQLLGLAFAYWLLFESVYRIKALCPYCLVVDVVMITLTWYLTLYIFDNKYISLPKGRGQRIYAWIRRHHLDILISWFIIIIALILKHFWYYYGRHL